MTWNPTEPMPIDKPKVLSDFEELGPNILNAMDPVELDNRIRGIANAIADKYHEDLGGDYEGCVYVVEGLLSATGNAIGGPPGAAIVGRCHSDAQRACRKIYLGLDLEEEIIEEEEQDFT